MHRIHLLFLILLLFGLESRAQAQNKENQSGTDTVYIATSAVCGMCKDRLEQELGYVRGVKEVHLNLENKRLMVVYRKQKTSAEALREKVAATGYRADDLPAQTDAYLALPACCQAEGCTH